MKVAVDFGDGVKREVDLQHTVIVENGKPKEVYRSPIITDPVEGKPCYVVFDPSTGKIKIHVLQFKGVKWEEVKVKHG